MTWELLPVNINSLYSYYLEAVKKQFRNAQITLLKFEYRILFIQYNELIFINKLILCNINLAFLEGHIHILSKAIKHLNLDKIIIQYCLAALYFNYFLQCHSLSVTSKRYNYTNILLVLQIKFGYFELISLKEVLNESQIFFLKSIFI